MEADKEKSKMTIDIGESRYEKVDVHFDTSMQEDDDQQIQGDDRNNEVFHGNTASNAHHNEVSTASGRYLQINSASGRYLLRHQGSSLFVLNTYEMLRDVEFNSSVSWSSDSTSFIIHDEHEFTAKVLPRCFPHNKIKSFITQLYQFGFRKAFSDKLDFHHERFHKGKEHWLKDIKRKRSAKKSQGQGERQQEQQGIDEMAALRKEEEMEEQVPKMKEEISSRA